MLRIDQGREPETHRQRDTLSGESERLERELHHHADGDADQHFLDGRQGAGA